MNTHESKLIVEAALLTAEQPLSVADLRRLLNEELNADSVRMMLDELRRDWCDRGLELVAVASGWRFQSVAKMQPYLDRLNPERPPKYSRAVMETLAIIAYQQPVTRGDIEDLRGVTVSSSVIKTLEERGWIEAVGQREVPGRPTLFATTREFLDDLGLQSLDQMPPLHNVGEVPAEFTLNLADMPPAAQFEDASRRAFDAQPSIFESFPPSTSNQPLS